MNEYDPELFSPLTKEEIFSMEKEWIDEAYRANGNVICDVCKKKYIEHSLYKASARFSYDGKPFLHELCNGDLVKL